MISTKSFADWYPEYAGTDYPAYDSSKLVAATVLVTNVSSEAIDLQRDFPLHNFSLWGENLDYIDDSLGARREPGQRVLLRERGLPVGARHSRTRQIGRDHPAVQGQQERPQGPERVRQPRPSDFCLQLVDFDSGTAYRLWL